MRARALSPGSARLGLLWLALLAAGLPGLARAKDAPLVASVELHLPPGVEPAGLAEQVAISVGQPLSRRAVRRTIERLFLTERFSDVVVRAFPAEGGVRVVVAVTLQRRIGGVAVEGNQVLDTPRLLAAARLERGFDYYPERLTSAIERVTEAYRRRGYEQVEISAELGEARGQIEILLRVGEGPPTRLAAVVVAGDPGLSLPRIVEELGLSVGSVLDLGDVDAGLERLRTALRAERYLRARVGVPRVEPVSPGKVRLSLPIEAGPRIRIRFAGQRTFPDSVLRSTLQYDGVELLDEAVIARMGRRLESFYRHRGFPSARVLPAEHAHPDGTEAVLVFEVEEGTPLRVERIEFEGNTAFSAGVLEGILAEEIRKREPASVDALPLEDPLALQGRSGSPLRAVPERVEPRTVYLESAYLAAAGTMTQVYRESGYLSAQVRFAGAEIDVEARRAKARFAIDEGPLAKVREVSMRGAPDGFNPILFDPATRRIIGPTLDEALVAEALEGGRRWLRRELTREGYLFSEVEAEVTLLEGGYAARVVYALSPGPRVKVGQVLFQWPGKAPGTQRTDDRVVRANLRVREGEVLDPDALFETQRNLVRLGIFRQVGVRVVSPEVREDLKDVVVELRERPEIATEFGGGYFVAEGPRLVLDMAVPNFGGQALTLNARGKINYVGASLLPYLREKQGLEALGGRGNVSLSQSRIYDLFPLDVGGRVDLIGEQVHRRSYTFGRFAAVAGLDWRLAPWLNVSTQYELEHNAIDVIESDEDGTGESQRLRFDEGRFNLLQSLRTAAALDFRDDPANPTRGLVISGAVELTRNLLPNCLFEASMKGSGCAGPTGMVDPAFSLPDIHALKFTADVTGYLPLSSRAVLALSARGGRVASLRPLELDGSGLSQLATIRPRRFYLGGSGTMRGFREDSLLPQDYRERLHRELESCPDAFSPDCTDDARVLREGREVLSKGGELFVLAKAELRLPAFGAFDMGIFFEAGNLWERLPALEDLFRLRTVVGAGLRYQTPVGPVAVDVGWNLAHDKLVNEQEWNVHFSIGLF